MLQGFPWERLPPEIRERILEKLLVADGEKVILLRHDIDTADPSSLSILRVSKQMHNEAYKVFYSGNIFHFANIPFAMKHLPKVQDYVKAIRFSVDVKEVNDEVIDEKDIENFLALVEGCRNLTSLYINISERRPWKNQTTHRQFPTFQHRLLFLRYLSVHINPHFIKCSPNEYVEFKKQLEAMFLNCFGESTATSSSCRG